MTIAMQSDLNQTEEGKQSLTDLEYLEGMGHIAAMKVRVDAISAVVDRDINVTAGIIDQLEIIEQMLRYYRYGDKRGGQDGILPAAAD